MPALDHHSQLLQMGFLGREPGRGLAVSATALSAAWHWAHSQRLAARGGGLSTGLAAGRKLPQRGGKVHRENRQLVCSSSGRTGLSAPWGKKDWEAESALNSPLPGHKQQDEQAGRFPEPRRQGKATSGVGGVASLGYMLEASDRSQHFQGQAVTGRTSAETAKAWSTATLGQRHLSHNQNGPDTPLSSQQSLRAHCSWHHPHRLPSTASLQHPSSEFR